jgi:hypothetical protein
VLWLRKGSFFNLKKEGEEMIRRKKEEDGGFLTYFGIILMILGLLFAGSDLANSQEKLPFPEDPLHLGNIQEMKMDLDSRIKRLEEDRGKTLVLIKSFREKGFQEASNRMKERLAVIEKELKFLLKNQ